MHPEIQSSKPGNCPKCRMKLIVQKAKAVKTKPERKADMGDREMPVQKQDGNELSQAVSYTCPMHPEIAKRIPESVAQKVRDFKAVITLTSLPGDFGSLKRNSYLIIFLIFRNDF